MRGRITFKPHGKSKEIRLGATILQAARDSRVFIPTRCGGKAACLMCKVTIEQGYEDGVSMPGEAECRKLGSLLEQGIRLACQSRIIGEAVVTVPEDPMKAAIRKQLERQREDKLW